jgi:hypothetical protein
MLASVKTATSICLRLPNNIDHRLNSSAGLITISVKAPAGDARNSPAANPGFDNPTELIDDRLHKLLAMPIHKVGKPGAFGDQETKCLARSSAFGNLSVDEDAERAQARAV